MWILFRGSTSSFPRISRNAYVKCLKFGNHIEPHLARRAEVHHRCPVHVELVASSPLTQQPSDELLEEGIPWTVSPICLRVLNIARNEGRGMDSVFLFDR